MFGYVIEALPLNRSLIAPCRKTAKQFADHFECGALCPQGNHIGGLLLPSVGHNEISPSRQRQFEKVAAVSPRLLGVNRVDLAALIVCPVIGSFLTWRFALEGVGPDVIQAPKLEQPC